MAKRRNRPGRTKGARAVAAEVVARVVDEDAFSQRALTGALSRYPLHRGDRSFVTRLVYLTLTRLRAIDDALEARLRKGLRSLKPSTRADLRIAAAQILFADDVPSFAAVDEAVEMIRRRDGKGVGGMANAILRKLVREGPVEPATDAERWSLPEWIAQELVARRGRDEAAAAMAVWNAPSAIHLRVRRGSEEEAIARLADEGIGTQRHPFVPGALVVQSGRVVKCPALRDGTVTIQDAGAQRVVQVVPGEARRILDLCAGTGGKTRHLLDRMPEATVVACDRHEGKLEWLATESEATDRLVTAAWDIPESPPEAVRGEFDSVLIDAPCSALGTLGRHPEVRWTRTPEMVSELSRVQRDLLDAAVPHVRAGGSIVYAVCTFTDAEGPQQVDAFLERHPDWSAAPSSESADETFAGREELWPDTHGTDGFFIARLSRSRSSTAQ